MRNDPEGAGDEAGWSPAALAAASAESQEHLAWYASAGMIVRLPGGRYGTDSLHRLRLIRYAHRRGISDDDLATAFKEAGDLLDMFVSLSSSDLSPRDLTTAAARAGVPGDLLAELLVLAGIDEPAFATQDDVEAIGWLGQALAAGIPVEALRQLIRVFVEQTERIADAEFRIFHGYVHEQLRASGLAGRELLEATHAVGEPALGLVEPALLYFHRRGWQKASREDLVRHLAEAATPPPAQPGETLVAVMFADLAGFTPLTLALGDQGVADVLRAFSRIVWERAAAHGGHIVKQIGDAFMLVFDRPADAIRFGLDAISAISADPDVPPLHIGAHWGWALYREGDYYGSTVNLAARVASSTDPGQFLVTADLHQAAAELVRATYRALPPRRVKGVEAPVHVVDVQA